MPVLDKNKEILSINSAKDREENIQSRIKIR